MKTRTATDRHNRSKLQATYTAHMHPNRAARRAASRYDRAKGERVVEEGRNTPLVHTEVDA